jgi:hypothetical protein
MIGGPVAAGAHEWRTADLSAALRDDKKERVVARRERLLEERMGG